jgi:hypothetical protein
MMNVNKHQTNLLPVKIYTGTIGNKKIYIHTTPPKEKTMNTQVTCVLVLGGHGY